MSDSGNVRRSQVPVTIDVGDWFTICLWCPTYMLINIK